MAAFKFRMPQKNIHEISARALAHSSAGDVQSVEHIGTSREKGSSEPNTDDLRGREGGPALQPVTAWGEAGRKCVTREVTKYLAVTVLQSDGVGGGLLGWAKGKEVGFKALGEKEMEEGRQAIRRWEEVEDKVCLDSSVHAHARTFAQRQYVLPRARTYCTLNSFSRYDT